MRHPALVLFVSIALLPSAGWGRQPSGAGSSAPSETVCSLKNVSLSDKPKPTRYVSITAQPFYEIHNGWHLSDTACHDKEDGTGIIRIEFPAGRSSSDFPELVRASSQEYMKAHVGERTFATLEGTVDYSNGYARFVLSKVRRVWNEK